MIKIELECNTVAEMTETLKSLLNTLTRDVVPQTKHAVDDTAGCKPAPAKPVPAPEKPATPAKPKPAPAPEPEKTPEEALDAALAEGGDEAGTDATEESSYTLEDAVGKAQALVAKGKSADVRKALTSVAGDGARIGNLKGDQIAAFIAALEG